MSTNIFNNVQVSGTNSLFLNNNNNLFLKSTDTNDLLLASNTLTGLVQINSGSGGIVLDSSFGTSGSGSISGGINLISKANSSWKTTEGNLLIETLNSGSLSLASAGVTTITSNGNGSWTNTSGNLTFQTATSGNFLITSAGVNELYSAQQTIITSSGSSNWTNYGGLLFQSNNGNLSLTTVGSGNLLLTSAGVTNIASVGNLVLQSTGNTEIASAGVTTITSNEISSWINEGSLILSNSIGPFTINAEFGSSLSISSNTTASLDSNGVLTIGSTSSSINIGKSGALTTILGNLQVNGTVNFDQQSETFSSTDVGAINSQTGNPSSGAIQTYGGIASKSNIISSANGAIIDGPILSITQNNDASNQPVAYFNQAYNNGSLLSFVGSSSNTENYTKTIVSVGSVPIASQSGFIKITLTDLSTAGDSTVMADADYYIPLYSIDAPLG